MFVRRETEPAWGRLRLGIGDKRNGSDASDFAYMINQGSPVGVVFGS